MYGKQYYFSALLVLFKPLTVSAELLSTTNIISICVVVVVSLFLGVCIFCAYKGMCTSIFHKCCGKREGGRELSPTTRPTIRQMEEERIPPSFDDHGNLVKFTALPSYDQSEQETFAFSPPPYDATQMIGPMNRPIPAEPPGYAGGRLHRALGRTPYGPVRTDFGNDQPPEYARRSQDVVPRPPAGSQSRNIAPSATVSTRSRRSTASALPHHSSQGHVPLRVSQRRHHLPPQRPSSQVPSQELNVAPRRARTQLAPPGQPSVQPRINVRRATSIQPNSRRSTAVPISQAREASQFR